MGRPPGRIHDHPFQMRVSTQFLKKVDRWRKKQPDEPSRAEAIRRLVEYAIMMAPDGKLPTKKTRASG